MVHTATLIHLAIQNVASPTAATLLLYAFPSGLSRSCAGVGRSMLATCGGRVVCIIKTGPVSRVIIASIASKILHPRLSLGQGTPVVTGIGVRMKGPINALRVRLHDPETLVYPASDYNFAWSKHSPKFQVSGLSMETRSSVYPSQSPRPSLGSLKWQEWRGEILSVHYCYPLPGCIPRRPSRDVTNILSFS